MITSVTLDPLSSPIEGAYTTLTVTVTTDTANAEHAFTWSVDGHDPVTEPELSSTDLTNAVSPKYKFTWAVELGLSPTTLKVVVTETDSSGNTSTDDDSQTYTAGMAAAATNRATAQAHGYTRFLGTALVDKLRQGTFPVSLQRSASSAGSAVDETLWVQILATTRAIDFEHYSLALAACLCPEDRDAIVERNAAQKTLAKSARGTRAVNLSGTRAYERIKDCSARFMKEHCVLPRDDAAVVTAAEEALTRLGRSIDLTQGTDDFPNVATVKGRIPMASSNVEAFVQCWDDHWRDLCLVELIWSYWHEEAMLVQTMKAISRRFQNRHAPLLRDPLANLEIDPLRPLANVLWGYVGDEVHRLSVLRRAHEYEHHYGLPLQGSAVAELRPADRRSKFLESFHNLLHACVIFYRSDDDNTVSADGFPVLNAIKETHYLIAQGAHNQFGDLPETARQEMLMEQWILARPEMRDFLRGRAMVPYPEPWMEAADAMKSLQGWTDTSVIHFRDLGVFGEQILLSVRYGSWATQTSPTTAVGWARFWRQEVQGYIHAYRAVTGVDLTAHVAGTRMALERDIPPSVHLRRRLAGRSLG